jgi:hypothetical protein
MKGGIDLQFAPYYHEVNITYIVTYLLLTL